MCSIDLFDDRETHGHADHLSAAQYYRKKFNVPVGIGKRISIVQQTFAPVYGFEPSSFVDAFDLLFQDEEEFKLGDLNCRVIHLGGHTPDHVGYVIGHSVFTGDSIFQPDVGSARSDFPGGDAKTLYSVSKPCKYFSLLLSVPSLCSA